MATDSKTSSPSTRLTVVQYYRIHWFSDHCKYLHTISTGIGYIIFVNRSRRHSRRLLNTNFPNSFWTRWTIRQDNSSWSWWWWWCWWSSTIDKDNNSIIKSSMGIPRPLECLPWNSLLVRANRLNNNNCRILCCCGRSLVGQSGTQWTDRHRSLRKY